MIYLARNENGVVIFDTRQKTKVFMQGQGFGDLLISYDTRDHDEEYQDGDWAKMDVGITSKDNPVLHYTFSNLFKKIDALIDRDPNKYYYNIYNDIPVFLRNQLGNSVEINFPSDSNSLEKVGLLSLEKRGDNVMSLNYWKCNDEMENKIMPHSVLMKGNGSRFPEIVELYGNVIADLYDAADMTYEEGLAKYNEAIRGKALTK